MRSACRDPASDLCRSRFNISLHLSQCNQHHFDWALQIRKARPTAQLAALQPCKFAGCHKCPVHTVKPSPLACRKANAWPLPARARLENLNWYPDCQADADLLLHMRIHHSHCACPASAVARCLQKACREVHHADIAPACSHESGPRCSLPEQRAAALWYTHPSDQTCLPASMQLEMMPV